MTVSTQPHKIGVLLVNLGTPEQPTVSAVREYLAEFLADHRVVELPKFIWLPILHGIILRTRPKKSAHAYEKIWTETGSPLMVISKQQQDALQKRFGEEVTVLLAMRYGQPSIAAGLKELQHCDEIIILPLYPQYSSPATGSIYEKVMRHMHRQRHFPKLRFINHYSKHPLYIKALANSITDFWQAHPRSEKLLFSFHGLPKNSIEKGDPYFKQCNETAALVAAELKLQPHEWMTVFQSRFGFQEWLQPYCDKTLAAFPKQGITSVDIICPGFAADCLETLEEMAIRNKEVFMEAGGKHYHYIPALNSTSAHIDLLQQLIKAEII